MPERTAVFSAYFLLFGFSDDDSPKSAFDTAFFAGTENLCGIVKKCSLSENRDKKGSAGLETVGTDNMKLPRHMPGLKIVDNYIQI